jgi:hypothetical protein
VPLHSELHASLMRQRCPVTGVSSPIGQILAHWVDKLKDPYIEYCSGLIRVSSEINSSNASCSDLRLFPDKGFLGPPTRNRQAFQRLPSAVPRVWIQQKTRPLVLPRYLSAGRSKRLLGLIISYESFCFRCSSFETCQISLAFTSSH